MINLLNHHKEKTRRHMNGISKVHYYIVLIGCGGNGGYAVQRITKMLSAFNNVNSFLMLADPDTVEEKNLLRQPFIATDIGKKKADVLAKRYGATYGLKIGSYSDAYIETVEQLESLFSHTDYRFRDGEHLQKVLIGAVDNDFSRQVMNNFFAKTDDLIYIDAGIEGVILPDGGNKPRDQWTEEETTEHNESGYSGQVVVGLKKKGQVLLPPLDGVYPIDAKDAIPPSHNCGVAPYQPQRMISNEMAALQITTIVNELFSSNSIIVNAINFNARSGNARPTFAEDVMPASAEAETVEQSDSVNSANGQDGDNEEMDDELGDDEIDEVDD
jgi:hypothetical protein